MIFLFIISDFLGSWLGAGVALTTWFKLAGILLVIVLTSVVLLPVFDVVIGEVPGSSQAIPQ